LQILERLARLCAVAAGVLLTVITLMTCVSLAGRNTVGWTIVGDFELSGAAAGAAIALFLPWCQFKRGNIIVDFFTARASRRTNEWLDRLGALLFALALALMAWRTGMGAFSAWKSQSGTMMIGFPEWIVYCAMLPPLALCVAIGLAQALYGFKAEARE
jgi:TRAP-type C4-dicarboxylate transport system permease small subunit